MRKIQSWFIALLMSAAIASPAIIAGCGGGHVRYYDAAYGDYHPWNHNEVVYYGQWETSTHRDHVEFRNRPAGDQAEYWKWRHSQH